MAYIGQEFVTANLPEARNPDPIPAGWYTMRIVEADIKDTKAGTGQYITIRFDVIGPTHEGRVVFGNINISNPSMDAERIGKEQIKGINQSLGIERLTDTDQLIGGVLQVKVNINKSDGYDPRNDVRGFKPAEGQYTHSTTSAPQETTPVKGATPPWAR